MKQLSSLPSSKGILVCDPGRSECLPPRVSPNHDHIEDQHGVQEVQLRQLLARGYSTSRDEGRTDLIL